jgi:hypothetical protein
MTTTGRAGSLPPSLGAQLVPGRAAARQDRATRKAPYRLLAVQARSPLALRSTSPWKATEIPVAHSRTPDSRSRASNLASMAKRSPHARRKNAAKAKEVPIMSGSIDRAWPDRSRRGRGDHRAERHPRGGEDRRIGEQDVRHGQERRRPVAHLNVAAPSRTSREMVEPLASRSKSFTRGAGGGPPRAAPLRAGRRAARASLRRRSARRSASRWASLAGSSAEAPTRRAARSCWRAA